MVPGYTPLELARAAGFLIRYVPTGSAVERQLACGARMLEVGPDATDDEIERHACRYLAPVAVHAA
jgi:hypothetical protein